MRKIDAFAHILPRAYLERLERQLEKTMAPSQLAYYREGVFYFDPVLTDLDARWRKIEPYGEYAQVLVLAVPPLEEVGPPEVAAEFARIANDEMADLVRRFPDRFVGFAAALPLSDVDEAARELDRALTRARRAGRAAVHQRPGRPARRSALRAAVRQARGGRPRRVAAPDAQRGVGRLSGRERVRLWPVVVPRLALRDRRRPFTPRLFRAYGAPPAPARDRAPRWRHGAALLSPTRDGSRLSAGQGHPSAATTRLLPAGSTSTRRSSARHTRCAASSSSSAREHVLFGTDMPLGPANAVEATIADIDAAGLSSEDMAAVYSGNAVRLLGL